MTEDILYDPNRDLKLVLKVSSNMCNIDCKYCFEKMKHIRDAFITEQQLENILKKIKNNVVITFHGGEPLLIGKSKMNALLNIVNLYKNKIKSVKIQTNGTLFDDEYAELFFKKYKDLNIEVAISLDGTYEMNKLRVDYKGNNTFDKVIDAYEILDKWGKKAGMLSVISKHSIKYVEDYADLIMQIKNLSFVKINPLFNIENNILTPDSISPMEFSQFIIKFGMIYIERKIYKKIAVEPILSMIQNINGKESKYCNYNKHKCFEFLSIYPNELIGPCDCFSINDFSIDKDTYFLEDSISKNILSNKIIHIKKLLDKCEECDIFEFCVGGCLSQRYYFRNNEALSKEFCDSKKMLFEFAKQLKI